MFKVFVLNKRYTTLSSSKFTVKINQKIIYANTRLKIKFINCTVTEKTTTKRPTMKRFSDTHRYPDTFADTV